MSNAMVFNDGDLVYCPMVGFGIYSLKEVSYAGAWSMCISYNGERDYLTKDGRTSFGGVVVIYHATLENKQLLDDFFGGEFDTPEVKQSGNDLTIELLGRGYEYVVCVAVDPPRKDGDLILVTYYMDFDGEFCAAGDSQGYKTVIPIQAFSAKANQWDGYEEWCNESSELLLRSCLRWGWGSE